MSENSTPPNSLFSQRWNDGDEGENNYARLSIMSLLAFIVALASFLVFLTPWLAFLPAVGILLALLATHSIRRSEGGLTGLRLAHLGLGLSVVSLAAVSVLWPVYRVGIQSEADRFFRIWFRAVQEGDIPQAKELQSYYWSRPKHDDPEKWWTDQYANKYAHRAVHVYVEDKLLRIMLALGSKADVRYYKMLSLSTEEAKDVAVAVYSVTYAREDGQKETFFVKMSGERTLPDPKGDATSAGWRLTSTPVLFVPKEI